MRLKLKCNLRATVRKHFRLLALMLVEIISVPVEYFFLNYEVSCDLDAEL